MYRWIHREQHPFEGREGSGGKTGMTQEEVRMWRGLGLSLPTPEASVSPGHVPVRHCCRIDMEMFSAQQNLRPDP